MYISRPSFKNQAYLKDELIESILIYSSAIKYIFDCIARIWTSIFCNYLSFRNRIVIYIKKEILKVPMDPYPEDEIEKNAKVHGKIDSVKRMVSKLFFSIICLRWYIVNSIVDAIVIIDCLSSHPPKDTLFRYWHLMPRIQYSVNLWIH